MEKTVKPPIMSRGALALLRMAREDDRYGAIAHNAALFTALRFAEQLTRACRDRSKLTLLELLNSESPPKNFLALTAAILQRVREQRDERHRAENQLSRAEVARDFDRHVLQGLAEALADLAWPERKSRDFDGPSLDECCSRLAEHKTEELWLGTIQHYLANILQDCFAAVRVREELRNLDPAREVNLRLIDARVLAEYVMQLASGMTTEEAEPTKIASALECALQTTLERGNER